MKRKIRLTEGDLHRIIKESVKHIINEYNEYFHYQDEEPSLTDIDDGDVERYLELDDAMNGTKKEQEDYDWEQFDRKRRIETDLPKLAMHNHPHYKDITNPFYSNNKHYASDYAKTGGSNAIRKDEFDKQWKP